MMSVCTKGQIDKEEMIKSLKKLGIPATGEEVDMLLEKYVLINPIHQACTSPDISSQN